MMRNDETLFKEVLMGLLEKITELMGEYNDRIKMVEESVMEIYTDKRINEVKNDKFKDKEY